MTTPKIIALPGDGIGIEVTQAALEVLDDRARRHDLKLEVVRHAVGGAALEKYGEPLPAEVLKDCLEAGVVLLGAVGDPRYDRNPRHLRPERALLGLRKELGLFANLRPIRPYRALLDASPLRRELVEGVDILIIRELTGGIYFGEPRGLERRAEGRVGFNSEVYHDYEVERIARVGFEAARGRRRHVTSVDKSNVLESSQLWRTVVDEVAEDYPDVTLEHMLVDNCAMQLIGRPGRFDVLLTTNMFGDILSDEGAMLTGSIGLLPSAGLGVQGEGTRIGMYEPVHGTAPDIAGRDLANPLAAVCSLALLFRYSLERGDIADEIETAVERVLEEGHRTADIAGPNDRPLGTRAMLEKVLEKLDSAGNLPPAAGEAGPTERE